MLTGWQPPPPGGAPRHRGNPTRPNMLRRVSYTYYYQLCYSKLWSLTMYVWVWVQDTLINVFVLRARSTWTFDLDLPAYTRASCTVYTYAAPSAGWVRKKNSRQNEKQVPACFPPVLLVLRRRRRSQSHRRARVLVSLPHN